MTDDKLNTWLAIAVHCSGIFSALFWNFVCYTSFTHAESIQTVKVFRILNKGYYHYYLTLWRYRWFIHILSWIWVAMLLLYNKNLFYFSLFYCTLIPTLHRDVSLYLLLLCTLASCIVNSFSVSGIKTVSSIHCKVVDARKGI